MAGNETTMSVHLDDSMEDETDDLLLSMIPMDELTPPRTPPERPETEMQMQDDEDTEEIEIGSAKKKTWRRIILYDSEEDENKVQVLDEGQQGRSSEPVAGPSRSRRSKSGSDVEEVTDSSPYPLESESSEDEETDEERRNQRNAWNREQSPLQLPSHDDDAIASDRDDDDDKMSTATTSTTSDRASEESSESQEHWSPPDPYISYLEPTKRTKKKKRTKNNQKPPKKRKRARKSKEPTEGSENSDSAEDQRSDDDYSDKLRGKGVQIVSIHKINLSKFDFDNESITEASEDEDEMRATATVEEKIISKIVAGYNSSSWRRQGQDEGYIEEKVICVPSVKPVDKKFFTGEDFNILIFTHQARIKGITLLKEYGVDKGSSTLHSLIFHYRRGEIFALTTGSAFNVVHSHCDYDFPEQIAARLLSNGKTDATYKNLIGNERSSKKSWKEGQEENPFDLLNICTKFEANMRDKASIFRLSCFRHSRERTTPKGVAAAGATVTKVQICFTSVRILRRFDVNDFLSILSHLSVIGKGEPTIVYRQVRQEEQEEAEEGDGEDVEVPEVVDEPEVDTTAHCKRLTEIPKGLTLHNDLERIVADKIFDYLNVQGHSNSVVIRAAQVAVENFGLCHKHMDDFAQATRFRLTYGVSGSLIHTFHREPSFREVLDALFAAQEIRDSSAVSTNKGLPFLNLLNKVSLEFTCRGGVVKKGSRLLEYVEGNVWHDNEVFWKVMTTWCLVSDEYSYIVHTQVIDNLKERLTTEVHGEDDDGGGPLVLHWPTSGDLEVAAQVQDDQSFDPEKFYVDRYEGRPGCWVPGAEEQPNKLFDMVQWVEEDEKLCIYFVASGFDGKICSKARKISTAAAAIKKACLPGPATTATSPGRRNQSPWLDKFYNKTKVLSPEFLAKFPTKPVFLAKLLEGTIMLAIANTSSITGGRESSLLKESRLEKGLTREGIIKILNEETDENGKTEMLNSLSRSFGIRLPVQGGNAIQVENRMNALATKIHDLLNSTNYLDVDSVTSKLLIATNFRGNSNVEPSLSADDEKFIFNEFILRRQSYFKIFLPKMGLVQICTELGKADWKMWKICEIPPSLPGETETRVVRKRKPSPRPSGSGPGTEKRKKRGKTRNYAYLDRRKR